MSRSTGATSSSASIAEVSVGVYSFDGKGDATLASDTNNAGTVTSNSMTGEYSVAANGRAKIITATGLGGCDDCQAPEVIAYLSGSNQGFVLDLLSGIGTGEFVAQTQSSFSTASLNGAYSVGMSSPPVLTTFSSGELLAASSGSLTETLDSTAPAALAPDVVVTYTEAVAANGRTLLKGSDGSTQVLYLISPEAGVQLNLSTTTPVAQPVQQ